MSTEMHISAEQWVKLIADNELPAITSTARMLDKFSGDDVSSLPKLSKAILHDQALSSCILKVANSVQYISVKKVTTVSRATVVLGIYTVKNICMTSKLIDGLLANHSLSDQVYQRLLNLMANSFYAGLLAKMMVSHYSENIQEQIYLAAMLHRIGETSFWSIGSDVAEELIKHQYLPDTEFERLCESELGISFNALSQGLAQTWNLSDLLLKSLDNPESRTVEMQIIYLADKLSRFINHPPILKNDFNQVLEDIAKVMKISVPRLIKKINAVRENAINLLNIYGARQLADCIKPMPQAIDFSNSRTAFASPVDISNELLLKSCMELTQLTHTRKDFNELIQCMLINSAKIFALTRSTFFIVNDIKTGVKARFSYDMQGNENDIETRINIASSINVFSEAVAHDKAMLINNYQEKQWRELITEDVEDIIANGPMVLVPVKIRNQVIGLFCGQIPHSKSKISEKEYQQLTFMTEQLNMCLTSISHH